MDNDIIAVKHELKESENIIVIDWGVSDVCNYRCSYCPPPAHKGDYPFYSIDKILEFSSRITKHYKDNLGKEVYFIYTGGEVTLYKDFIKLVKTLKENGSRAGISSNGSKDIEFWKEAKKYLEHISLSYHVEFTNLDHFIDVINTVKDGPYTHVNIMVKPDQFEKCIDAAYRVYEQTDNITMDVQIVLKDFLEPYPYTKEQRERIYNASKDINSRLKLKREIKGYRGNGFMRLVYSSGKEELIKGPNIVVNNLHSWKNWQCNIGLELLVVNVNGDITRSWCGQGGVIGNVSDETLNFPDKPYKCGNEWCPGGITDIMITKNKIPR